MGNQARSSHKLFATLTTLYGAFSYGVCESVFAHIPFTEEDSLAYVALIFGPPHLTFSGLNVGVESFFGVKRRLARVSG